MHPSSLHIYIYISCLHASPFFFKVICSKFHSGQKQLSGWCDFGVLQPANNSHLNRNLQEQNNLQYPVIFVCVFLLEILDFQPIAPFQGKQHEISTSSSSSFCWKHLHIIDSFDKTPNKMTLIPEQNWLHQFWSHQNLMINSSQSASSLASRTWYQLEGYNLEHSMPLVVLREFL